MKYIKLNLISIILMLTPLTGLIPLQPFDYFISSNDYELTVSNCGEEGKSVFFVIEKGDIKWNKFYEFDEPIKLKTSKDTICIQYTSLPNKYLAAIKNRQIQVSGNVINILKNERTNNYIMQYEVEKWKLDSYIPYFKTWNTFNIIFIGIIFIYGIILFFRKDKSHINNTKDLKH